MSLIARVRHHLSHGLSKHIQSTTGVIRYLSQSANLEGEVELDQKRLPADYGPSNFDPTEHPSSPSEKVLRLVEEVSALTIAEAVELGIILMKKKGIKEKPAVGVMKPGVQRGRGAAKEEQKPEKTFPEVKMP